MSLWALASLPGLAIWLCILLLPWRAWSVRERMDVEPQAVEDNTAVLSRVTVLIPARNEAERLTDTLSALQRQGEGFSVVLIDDQSDDDTAQLAARHPLSAMGRLRVVRSAPLPAGWSGKLWALEQGTRYLQGDYILLLDADIRLAPGLLASLCQRLHTEALGMISLMARLRMQSLWERLLLPAFVFFFKLLYPFRLVNDPRIPVAAAAGGVILIRRQALLRAGGFAAIHHELIDDCALARAVKRCGYPVWIGLTHSAHSTRPCHGLGAVWDMVRRTAYSQLRFSPLLLLLCTLLMCAAFVLPPLCLIGGMFAGDLLALAAAVASLLLMLFVFLPTLRYYQLPMSCGLGILLAGLLFLPMTWHSALAHHCGRGAVWKGRQYP